MKARRQRADQRGQAEPARARRPARVYCVYVVELDREAIPARLRRTRVAGCVYVGQTVKSPEERFAQHMRGGRLANTKVYQYGRRLRPDLYRAWNPFPTRREAEAAEEALAMELERRGYVVFWG
jgi:hypothetical protein